MSAIKQLFRKLPTTNPQLSNVAAKLTDMTWYSFFESGENLKVSYIFRSKDSEMLVIKNGKVLTYTWNIIPSTSALLLNLADEKLPCYPVLLKGHYLLLRIEGTGDYRLLINHAYFQRILEVAPKKVEQVIMKDLNNLIPEPDIPVIELANLEEDEPHNEKEEVIDNEIDSTNEEELTTPTEVEETFTTSFDEPASKEEELSGEFETGTIEEQAPEEEEETIVEETETVVDEMVEEEVTDNQLDNDNLIQSELEEEEISEETDKQEERSLSILQKLHQQKGLVADNDEDEEEDEVAYRFGEKKPSLNDKLKEKLNKEKQGTLLDKLANKAKKD